MYAQIIVITLNGLYHVGYSGGGSVFEHRKLEITHGVKIRRGRGYIGLADIEMIDLYTPLGAFYLIRIELADRGKVAFFDLARKLHLMCSS